MEASSTARNAAGALFEREAELAATEAATSRARGGGGGLLLIEGSAGIGKSRLLEAACENAAEAGMTVLDAHGSELERGFSFGVVLQLLGGRVGDAADDEDLFDGPARFARRVFEDARPNGRGGADTTFPIYHGLHWLVAHLAERAPLALAVTTCTGPTTNPSPSSPTWPLAAGSSRCCSSSRAASVSRYRRMPCRCWTSFASALPRPCAAMHVRSIARYRRGRIVESVADAERAADAGGSGWGATLPLAHAQLALGRLELGDVEGASGALELPGGEQRWAAHVAYGAYLLARAEVLRARGEPEAALEQFELAGRLGEMVGVSMPALLPWRLGASAILVDRGEREHAAELAERQLEDARAYGAAGPIGAALRGLARAHGGADAVELLRESADLLDDAPDRLERARSLVELGAAMRRSGSRRNARDVLRQGLDAAYGCGAAALAELARAELRAAGGRLRRDALSGPEALTPSERRVAELALDGMTNREIAQHLFVTKRTVEMHLSGAYGKLRIGSREELGPALDSRSPALAE